MTEAAQTTVRLSDAFASAAFRIAFLTNRLPPKTTDKEEKLSLVFDKEKALDVIFVITQLSNKPLMRLLLAAFMERYLTEEPIHCEGEGLEIISLARLLLSDIMTLAPEATDWESLDQIGIINITYTKEASEGTHYGIRFLENVPDFELALIERPEERDASPPCYAQITLLEQNHP